MLSLVWKTHLQKLLKKCKVHEFISGRVKVNNFTKYITIPVNLWELLGGRSPPYQLF